MATLEDSAILYLSLQFEENYIRDAVFYTFYWLVQASPKSHIFVWCISKAIYLPHYNIMAFPVFFVFQKKVLYFLDIDTIQNFEFSLKNSMLDGLQSSAAMD